MHNLSICSFCALFSQHWIWWIYFSNLSLMIEKRQNLSSKRAESPDQLIRFPFNFRNSLMESGFLRKEKGFFFYFPQHLACAEFNFCQCHHVSCLIRANKLMFAFVKDESIMILRWNALQWLQYSINSMWQRRRRLTTMSVVGGDNVVMRQRRSRKWKFHWNAKWWYRLEQINNDSETNRTTSYNRVIEPCHIALKIHCCMMHTMHIPKSFVVILDVVNSFPINHMHIGSSVS